MLTLQLTLAVTQSKFCSTGHEMDSWSRKLTQSPGDAQNIVTSLHVRSFKNFDEYRRRVRLQHLHLHQVFSTKVAAGKNFEFYKINKM